jgi:hypothetical protein
VPLALILAVATDGGKIGFAISMTFGNSIYRYDEGTEGTWICSIPFKLVMAGMLAYAILYHTKIFCFGG